MRQQIDAYLEQKREELLEDIRKLVAIPSIHGQTEACLEALNYVRRRAEDFGMKTRMTSTQDVCVVELGSGREIVGVLTHVDVVGVGDPEKWVHPPFEATRAQGALWGRGTVDDKGPVMMSLYALRALKELEVPLNKRIWLIVGTCEEGIWTDMEHFKQEFERPAFGFTPDGNFPIFNVEKGYADVSLTFAEPAAEQILFLSAGDSRNTIPSLAVIQTRDGGRMEYNGVSAHSSAPELADNAIVKLCEDLEGRYPFSFLRFVTGFLSDYHVPALELDDGTDQYMGEYAGRTTAVPTVLTKEDGAVVLNINLRHKVGVTREQIVDAFRRHETEYGYRAELIECQDPIMVSEKLPALQLMKQVYESYGYEGKFLLAQGCTYAKSMDRFVCWGPVLPEDPECAHMENEHIMLAGMMTAAKMYATYLARAASEPGI